MTTTADRSRVIRTPVEPVWEVLADFDAIAAWAPTVDHSSSLTEPAHGPGASRRIQVGRRTLVESVLDWDPPKRLGYRLEGLPRPIRSVTNEWRLEPDPGGTLVTITTTVDVGPRPPQRLLERLTLRRLTKVSDGLLSGLAARLDDPEADR